MPALSGGAVAGLLVGALLTPGGMSRADATLRALNAVREAHGLAALRADPRLAPPGPGGGRAGRPRAPPAGAPGGGARPPAPGGPADTSPTARPTAPGSPPA